MAVKLNKIMVLVILAVLVFTLPGCSRDKQELPAEKPATTDAEKSELSTEVISIKGKVLEVVEADSFIFLLLDRGDEQTWATLPAVDVKVGEEVTLLYANIFGNFYSKSMNRSFDELIFASGIEGKSTGRRVALSSTPAAVGSSPTK